MDPLSRCIGIRCFIWVRRSEGLQDGQGHAAIGARGIDRQVDRVAESGYSFWCLIPFRKAGLPLLCNLRCVLLRCPGCAAPLRPGRPTARNPVAQAVEMSAGGCRGRPWDQYRWPGCRRWRLLPAARGTVRSCRCRSCRRRPRGWSGRENHKAGAHRRALSFGRCRIPGRVESAQLLEVGHAAIIRRGVPCYFSAP